MGTATSNTSPRRVTVGDRLLDRYRVLELIAEGGQSLVFRVEDERLRRTACAKVFHAPDVEPQAVAIVERGFVAEAFLLSRLASAAALQIYDFGFLPPAQPGRPPVPVQICELVADGPLSMLVKRRGPLPPPDVMNMILPISRALAELHASGIVHLDVKPQNILLRMAVGEYHTKLADFGIAQAIGTTPSSAENPVLMYSLNWAAPEQLVGETVGPSCDVYSLALVSIYALTGRLVFHEIDAVEGYRLRRYADDVIQRTIEGCDIPPAAVELLLQACSFEVERRPSDVHDFGRRLSDAFELQPPAVVLPPAARELTPSRMSYPENPAAERSRVGRMAASPMWSIGPDRPSPDIAGRKVSFVALSPQSDVAPLGNAGRIRLALVPSNTERPALQIKALNCFVATAGGRPSAAITLREGRAIELVSPRGDKLARATVSFAAEGRRTSLATLGDEYLVIDGKLPPSQRVDVLVDFGPGNVCFIAQGAI